MKAAGTLVAITVALVMQTTLDRVLAGGAGGVDLVLVAVVYVALTSGPVGGMLAGSLAGIVQDSLGTGIIGVGGLAKSTVGFFAGVFGQQFIVTSALPRLAMFLAATVVQAVVFLGLYAAIDGRSVVAWGAVATQAMANAVVGMVAFAAIEGLPGVVERRRTTRRGRY